MKINYIYMKNLFIQLAEERLKGQPRRHAKAFKGDISSFEADMMTVAGCLSKRPYNSLGEISIDTKISKSTLQKLLTQKGIKRTYNKVQLERMRKRNKKRYLKILEEHNGIIQDNNGKWRGLVYRNSDLIRFSLWLIERGNMLLSKPALKSKGKSYYHIIPAPQDGGEQIRALYEYLDRRQEMNF